MKVGDLVKLHWTDDKNLPELGILVRYEVRTVRRKDKEVLKEGWVVLWTFLPENIQMEMFTEESKMEVI